MTWVLVLLITHGGAAIPGYATLADCQAAGTRALTEKPVTRPPYRLEAVSNAYACIPGPRP